MQINWLNKFIEYAYMHALSCWCVSMCSLAINYKQSYFLNYFLGMHLQLAQKINFGIQAAWTFAIIEQQNSMHACAPYWVTLKLGWCLKWIMIPV